MFRKPTPLEAPKTNNWKANPYENDGVFSTNAFLTVLDKYPIFQFPLELDWKC
jgi:hypothetical protein